MARRRLDLPRTEPLRLAVYGVMGTLAALGVLYGVVSDAEAALWVELGVGVAGIVFATEAARDRVTPTGKPASVDKGSGGGESRARQ